MLCNLLILLVTINQQTIISNAFNLENRLPIVKYGSNSNSYFGYSVAAHTLGEKNWSNNTNWLLVGAPLDKNLQPGTNRTGALYKCPITQNFDDCEQVITDGRRSRGGAYNLSDDDDDVKKLWKPASDEMKENQWLGVTVRSQGLGGKVLVCAHRYITVNGENNYGQGLCYLLTNDFKYDEAYEPCRGYRVERNHEDYALCQAGTSGALLEDDSMVVGSPGLFTWRGTVFVTEIGGEYLYRDKNTYYGDYTEKSSPIDKYSYLGMAVTGGRYFGYNISYAAGAPRSNDHGQVVIFDKAKSNPIPVKMIIDGEQFGAGFGYELSTADLNGDKKPDLIVSAPFYFAKNEGGAVYIYQNENNTLPKIATLILTGTAESRFGLAVANIGDINKDSCDDLAIGAPYEGGGVVYIYLGSPTGLQKKPSQRIAATDLGMLPKPLKTFGSSIAGGTDLDGNSYPDILVGAYNSSAVVALLSRPIISIQTQWRSSEMKNIDPTRSGCITDAFTNLTCFTFEACCSIDPYEQVSVNKDLLLRYTVEAETFAYNKKFSRVFFDRDNKRNNFIKEDVSIRTDGKLACQRVTCYIKENTRDIQSPIRFRLNYTIVESKLASSGLKMLNPILDQRQASVEFEGTFQKDCGDNDICESNLILNAELDLNIENDNYALILGNEDEIRVNVNVSNVADSAYETQLFVVHQNSVSYIATVKTNAAICNQFNKTVVACTLGNPMRRGTAVQVSIRFDPRGLDINETKLTFQIYANTTSKLVGITAPEKKLDVRVIKRAELSLQGWARPQQSFFSGEIKSDNSFKNIEDAGTQLLHTFQIYNEGPWRAPKVILNIFWPNKYYNERHKKERWLLYLEESPIIESSPQGTCSVAADDINPLKLTSKFKIPSIMEEMMSAPSNYMMHPSNKSMYFSHLSQQSNKRERISNEKNNDVDILKKLNRVRREMIARILRPERFMDIRDIKNKKRDIIELDCNKDTANCIQIQCEFYNMPAKAEAYVHIKARLWNSTLMTEFPRVDLVKIISSAQVKIPLDFNVEQRADNDHILVETRAYPEWLDHQLDTTTPLWIIILSVLGGLLLLALFTYIMWKCGFFKRKRPDPTLSGNLEKMSEKKPFLNTQSNQKMF